MCFKIFVINAFCCRTLSLKLSRETLNNGSLYLHLFLLPRQVIVKKWSEASKASDSVYTRVALSHYQVPSSATYQLLSGKNLSHQCLLFSFLLLSPAHLNFANPKVSFILRHHLGVARGCRPTPFFVTPEFCNKMAIICKKFTKFNVHEYHFLCSLLIHASFYTENGRVREQKHPKELTFLWTSL